MRIATVVVMCLTALNALARLSIDDIAERLLDSPCAAATVRYEVLMPSAADPVVYTVELLSMPNEGDTLAPSDYLIDWILPRGENVSHGFCSYASGVHFRYRDTKLQEYHYAEDPRPFNGDKGGVQMTAQFVDLLPQIIGKHLVNIKNDTTYHSKFDEKRLTLSGVQTFNGYDALEYTYTFDAETFLPLQIDMVYNPASISEQSVSVDFDWHDADCPTISEEYLTGRYADIFEKFRTSNFRVENLPGTPMPTYTGYTAQRHRVSYDRGTVLNAPTIFVFIDPGVSSNHSTIEAVRTTLASLPMAVDVVYVFAGNDPEDAVSTIGPLQPVESILISGRGLIRDCGVTAFPTILLVGSDGVIADSVVGANKDLSGLVTQKMILVK